MEDKSRRYVVIAGSCVDGRPSGFMQAIGIFNDSGKAYGEAYLYLADMMADGYGDEKARFTPPLEIEGDTGFEILLEDEHGNVSNYVYILFCEGEVI